MHWNQLSLYWLTTREINVKWPVMMILVSELVVKKMRCYYRSLQGHKYIVFLYIKKGFGCRS
jgi:hypothetical protein